MRRSLMLQTSLNHLLIKADNHFVPKCHTCSPLGIQMMMMDQAIAIQISLLVRVILPLFQGGQPLGTKYTTLVLISGHKRWRSNARMEFLLLTLSRSWRQTLAKRPSQAQLNVMNLISKDLLSITYRELKLLIHDNSLQKYKLLQHFMKNNGNIQVGRASFITLAYSTAYQVEHLELKHNASMK